jgi:hypothetical protein
MGYLSERVRAVRPDDELDLEEELRRGRGREPLALVTIPPHLRAKL